MMALEIWKVDWFIVFKHLSTLSSMVAYVIVSEAE